MDDVSACEWERHDGRGSGSEYGSRVFLPGLFFLAFPGGACRFPAIDLNGGRRRWLEWISDGGTKRGREEIRGRRIGGEDGASGIGASRDCGDGVEEKRRDHGGRGRSSSWLAAGALDSGWRGLAMWILSTAAGLDWRGESEMEREDGGGSGSRLNGGRRGTEMVQRRFLLEEKMEA